MVEFLVQSGLDVKQQTSKKERTVLGFAATETHLNVVDYLLNTNTVEDILSLGADPIVMVGFGGSVEIFNRLVIVGFDPLQRNKNGQTTVHMALAFGKEELAFYIMKHFPSLISMTIQYGWSTLHCAAEGGSITLLQHLINIGLDTRYVDEDGETILHTACFAGKRDAVMFLTQHHMYLIHIKANDGRTALHHASEGGSVDVFKHLVTAGLNTHDCDNNMHNLLHYACCDRNHEMTENLLQQYSDHMIQQDEDGCILSTLQHGMVMRPSSASS